MIAEIRDYIIIFGIIFSLIFLSVSTILTIVIFVKIKRILNYIENSLTGLDTFKNKIKETLPKPFANIINGALTVKKIMDSATRKWSPKKESQKDSKKESKEEKPNGKW